MRNEQKIRADSWDPVDETIDESFPASDPSSGTLGRDHMNEVQAVPTSDGRRLVAGVFSERAAATRAIEELIEAHFDAEQDLRVIVAHHRSRREVPVRLESGIAISSPLGIALGAVFGAFLALLASTRSIGAPIALLAGAPWVVALKGAAIGAAAGYIVGTLGGLGFWKEKVDFLPADANPGAIWLGVRATLPRTREARAIMQRAGARHFRG